MSWLSNLFGNKVSQPVNGFEHPEIKEKIFIEKPLSPPNNDIEKKNEKPQDNIHLVYTFLSKDYQQQGYNDALVHPETSYMVQKVKEFKAELDIVIRKVKTFYEDTMRELDFLILSRNRLGMVDVVDELKMKKEKAADHYKKILEIEQETIEQGESHKLVISYNRGFQNGMAAIAIHEANKREF
jgi:hypothetical protein